MPTTEGAQPVVETYERWSLDGRKKLERGKRELARTWEKHLWAILEEAEKQANPKAGRQPRMDLLERLAKGLGSAGFRRVGSWVMGWSLGEGRAEKGGRVSVGRTAVFTFRPAGPGDAVTPPDDEAKEGAGPVTPGDGATPIERLLRRGLPPSGSGMGRASGEGSADSERDVREHAVVEMDLMTTPRPTTPPKPPSVITPPER